MGVTRRVGILVFDDVEVLDLAGPFEVLSVASRLAVRRGLADAPPFEVVVVGRSPSVTARGGLQIVPGFTLDDAPDLDVLIVPGGLTDDVEGDPAVIDWVRRRAGEAELAASVCTGAFVLAAAGMLDGRTATTHWEDRADLAGRYPAVQVVLDRRWIDHGDVVTAAGISAGIDMALHLVERFVGRELAEATARQMEYRWLPEP
jgi:transcriptional regulator GlxA family with amidase domain